MLDCVSRSDLPVLEESLIWTELGLSIFFGDAMRVGMSLYVGILSSSFL